MPRTIWKGSISFGLVNIPVALLPGEQREELHFALLDSRDKTPVGYKRINKNTGDEVAREKPERSMATQKANEVTAPPPRHGTRRLPA